MYLTFLSGETRKTMNTEFFIARRLYKERKGGKRISRPAVAIAQWGMAVGTIVMIVSIAIIVGFKNEIRDKIYGFSGHMQITGAYSDMENVGSITADGTLMNELSAIKGVSKVQPFIQKAGMILVNGEYEGVLIKGVGKDYDKGFIGSRIIEGEMPQFSDTVPSERIVISQSLADKIRTGIGDKITIYFFDKGIRARRLAVSAIYKTHLSEIDNVLAITDIYTARSVHDWADNEVSAIEVHMDEGSDIAGIKSAVANAAMSSSLRNGEYSNVLSAEELYPAMFAWLGVLDQTVWIILVLVICIAAFTMVSGLLILILEKGNLIGILKAIGTKNVSIRKIFIFYACFIIGKGMIIGNAIGILLCIVQQQTGIIAIDPEMYYMDRVPIEFSWMLVPLNIVMFIISAAVLLVPSMLISKIEPTKAIKFE